MWQVISRIILRNRIIFLAVWICLTAFMTWQTQQVKLGYELNKSIPDKAQANLDYEAFKDEFGDEGNLVVIAVNSEDFFLLSHFNEWTKLSRSIAEIKDVQQVLSVPQSIRLLRNNAADKFDIAPVFPDAPKSQAELDSLRDAFYNLPFYNNRLYNEEKDVFLMLVSLDRDILTTVRRITVMDDIYQACNSFEETTSTELHYTGLPVIRHFQLTRISDEIQMFLILAVLVTVVVLFILFRSWIAVLFPLLIIGSGVVFSMGLMTLIGYKVTLLTGLIPSLLLVIGVPNCVYLLNKYHIEFRKHGNKIKALTVIIEKVGYAMFFTNLTTGVGFGVFYFTGVSMLKEFGLITFISIVMTFLISIIILPAIFSFLPKPRKSDTNHLNNNLFQFLIEKLVKWTFHHSRTVIAVAVILLIAIVPGVLRIHSTGYILDDVSEKTSLYKDQVFFEEEFNGVLPLEIVVARKPLYNRHIDTVINALYDAYVEDSIVGFDTVYIYNIDTMSAKVTGYGTLSNLAELQDLLASYECLSTSLSILDGMKFARQAYYNGSTRYYSLPNFQRLTSNDRKVGDYLQNTGEAALTRNTFTDASGTKTRISLQVADIGSDSMPKLLAELRPRVDSIFDKEVYDVTFTGTSVVAMEGYNYLIKSLIGSVSLALVIIAFIMTTQFRSLRMLLLALLPNLIPLFFTAALMGYLNIPLKPSTVLIFSVAFGIAVDYSIHFLAKYRQELVRHSFNVRETVRTALHETGMSMIYTSIILFFGFFIFTFSDFEGTKNLGILTSVTLVVALLTNMLLLPTLLLIFDKKLEQLHKKRHYRDKPTFAEFVEGNGGSKQ